MNCKDLDQSLIEGDNTAAGRLPREARDHIEHCARCREFMRALSPTAVPDPPSELLVQNIRKRLTVGLTPVRPLAPRPYFIAGFIGIFVAIAAVFTLRLGAFAVPVMSPAQRIVILCVLAGSVWLLASSLAGQMVPGSRQRIPPVLLSAGIVIVLALVLIALFSFRHEEHFWRAAWACIRAGTPIGLLAAVPFWLVLRRGAVLSPRVAGTATGLLAGLVGTSVLEIHCPNFDLVHLLVAHLGVATLCALIGFIAGSAVATIGHARKLE